MNNIKTSSVEIQNLKYKLSLIYEILRRYFFLNWKKFG